MGLETFRQKSLEKFRSMQAEGELFKKQTMFKDFENDKTPGKFSKDFGFKILENPKNVSVNEVSKIGDHLLDKLDIGDKFVQMNNAFFDSGAVIEVPKDFDGGTLRIVSRPERDLFSKLVVVMGDGSRMNLVKECYSAEPHTVCEDVLVIAGSDSRISFSELQNFGRGATAISNKIAACGKDSRMYWNLGMFGSGATRSRTYNFLDGDGSSVEDLQLVFGDGGQQFDTFSNLIHVGKSTTGKSLAKGAFRDKSASIMKGMIKIREKAKNASSYLACHGMLLSKDAKANAIPSLEIETNDVKATHSASVSPIDEEKIFYLTSRGLAAEDAKKMLTLGFFDPLILRVSSEEVRAKIRYLIEAKWSGLHTESFESKMLKEFAAEDAIKSGDMFEGHYKYR